MNTALPLVTDILTEALDSTNMTQAEIASKLGYSRANIITMWKKGRTPLPIKKVPQVASLLNLNSKELLRSCLSEYHPDVYTVLVDELDWRQCP